MRLFLVEPDSSPDEGKLVLAPDLLPCFFLETVGHGSTSTPRDQLSVIGAELGS
jgi:hypothetical protein